MFFCRNHAHLVDMFNYVPLSYLAMNLIYFCLYFPEKDTKLSAAANLQDFLTRKLSLCIYFRYK
jgi:hypothetical protein